MVVTVKELDYKIKSEIINKIFYSTEDGKVSEDQLREMMSEGLHSACVTLITEYYSVFGDVAVEISVDDLVTFYMSVEV